MSLSRSSASPGSSGGPFTIDAARLELAASFLKALGHPLRLELVMRLARGEANVSTLADEVRAPQAIVSQQLRILRMSNVVAARRSSGQRFYRLSDARVPRLLHCIGSCP